MSVLFIISKMHSVLLILYSFVLYSIYFCFKFIISFLLLTLVLVSFSFPRTSRCKVTLFERFFFFFPLDVYLIIKNLLGTAFAWFCKFKYVIFTVLFLLKCFCISVLIFYWIDLLFRILLLNFHVFLFSVCLILWNCSRKGKWYNFEFIKFSQKCFAP